MSISFHPPALVNYTLLEEIGQGTTATVYLALENKTNVHVAIKAIAKTRLNAHEAALVKAESEILQRLSHPNLLKVLDSVEDSTHFYLITEMCDGGELFQSIVEREYYTEKDAQRVCRSLAEALEYCHANRVVHRDLKPENILLSSKEPDAVVKIADFGYSKEIEDNLQSEIGSPSYVAPEILKKQPYDTAVDMWSFGVIVYVMLCGYLPFFSENVPEMFKKIISGEFQFDSPYWDSISSEAKDLIKKCLVLDPKQRLTATQVLKHPWIMNELPETDITPAIKDLKKLLLRRVIKRTALTVVMAQKLKRLTSQVMQKQVTQ